MALLALGSVWCGIALVRVGWSAPMVAHGNLPCLYGLSPKCSCNVDSMYRLLSVDMGFAVNYYCYRDVDRLTILCFLILSIRTYLPERPRNQPRG